MDQSDRVLLLRHRGFDRDAIAAIIGLQPADIDSALKDSGFDPATPVPLSALPSGVATDAEVATAIAGVATSTPLAHFTQAAAESTASGALMVPDWTEARDDGNRWTTGVSVMGGSDEELVASEAGVFEFIIQANFGAAGANQGEIEFRHYTAAVALIEQLQMGEDLNTPSGNAPKTTRTVLRDLAVGAKIVIGLRQNAGAARNLQLDLWIKKLA
jgi:hypothetical protein